MAPLLHLRYRFDRFDPSSTYITFRAVRQQSTKKKRKKKKETEERRKSPGILLVGSETLKTEKKGRCAHQNPKRNPGTSQASFVYSTYFFVLISTHHPPVCSVSLLLRLGLPPCSHRRTPRDMARTPAAHAHSPKSALSPRAADPPPERTEKASSVAAVVAAQMVIHQSRSHRHHHPSRPRAPACPTPAGAALRV